jgi:hypothetical protein
MHTEIVKARLVKLYLEYDSSHYEDTLLINMDRVADELDKLGLSKQHVLDMISSRMLIDTRLLQSPRDNALVPIGDILLGTFSWKNRKDVACSCLARISADVPEEHVRLWRALLTSYNYLAASKYRNLQRPADPAFGQELTTAVAAFESSVETDLLGASGGLVRLGFRWLLPHIIRAEAECTKASDRLLLGDYRGVVLALEIALTHYHTVVRGIQPAMT